MIKPFFFFFFLLITCCNGKILLLTASFGGIDDIASFDPDYREEGVDYFFMMEPPNFQVMTGWEIVIVDHVHTELSPRMKAKYFKMQAHIAFPNYDAYLWIDSSYRIVQKGHVQWFMDQIRASNYSIAFRRHPQRNTVKDELQFCLSHMNDPYLKTRYGNERIEEQVQHYIEQGFPDDVGLYAGGMFAYLNTHQTRHFFDRWWLENLKWTVQDQLSLPFIIWNTGTGVLALPAGLGSEFINWVGHRYTCELFSAYEILLLLPQDDRKKRLSL